MPRKPRLIEQLLQNKFGFTTAKGHSSDHKWYELQLEGLPTILTKVSHSKKDAGSRLEGKIARQLRVKKPFFNGMMDCQNNRDAYENQVRTDPYPPFDVLL